MARDDGGAAFPKGGGYGQDGMSLRDWFAGQALAGILACPVDRLTTALEEFVESEKLAQTAYQLAEAMLAARSEPAPPIAEED